ncbi:MAG: LacI family DNA-binding transcriptional regulator [Bacteroidetes bacterium]|nr:LacI family DNA-binding transcriptional regulator [Bacteroidota bacterium]MCH8524635.1 LacI family transcriptional regulator [Balneolales bacterium]
MKVTLKSIAKETGYSMSTVSRVLNGSSKYSENTRVAIFDAARTLKYEGIRLRPSDHPKKHLNIVLLADFYEGEFYASYFSGYVKATASQNIRLSLISIKNQYEMISEVIGQRSDRYYDAAILFAPKLDRDDYLTILDELPDNFPVISNALIETPVLQTITFDGYSGGHLAAKYFQKKGYKNLGIVKGPAQRPESRFRYNGFTDYVSSQSDLKLVFEVNGDFNFESGVDAFMEFQQCKVKPEAIFVANDLMCHGFLETASHCGVKIPEDIALLGYDDLPMCTHSNPKISSVKTDFENLASASIAALKQRIQHTDTATGMLSLIPVTISERETS